MFEAIRPSPKHFELQAGVRQLRVERHVTQMTPEMLAKLTQWHHPIESPKETDGWCIWLAANKNFTIGTYLLLRDDGSIARATIQASGEEYVFEYE